MDLGKRRISEDERERVSSHHSNATDSVDGGAAAAAGSGGGVSSISRSLSATGDVRATVSSSDSALHLLAGGGVVASGVASSGRGRPPSAGPSMDSSAGSSVGVSSVLGGPGGGTGGTGGSGGGGVGASGGGGGDESRGVMVTSGRVPPQPTSGHHMSNGGVGRSGSAGAGGGGGAGAGTGAGRGVGERERERDRDRRQSGGGGGGSYRGHGGGSGGGGRSGGGGGGGGQAWIGSGEKQPAPTAPKGWCERTPRLRELMWSVSPDEATSTIRYDVLPSPPTNRML